MEMANPQQTSERFSGKHLRIVKESGKKGLVLWVSFSERPKEIEDIKGRRILYQRPVGDCGDGEYQIVYFIPECQKEKIAFLPSYYIKKVFRILPCENGDHSSNVIIRKLKNKGVFLQEVSFK